MAELLIASTVIAFGYILSCNKASNKMLHCLSVSCSRTVAAQHNDRDSFGTATAGEDSIYILRFF